MGKLVGTVKDTEALRNDMYDISLYEINKFL